MYYALIILAVVFFGGGFAINDVYRKKRGDSIKTSLEFNFTSSIAGLVALVLINGLRLEFSVFTLIMAILTALNGFFFTLCSFRALGSINLSVYSIFSMLGGMVLPFLQGIVIYGEDFTLAKAVCLVFITVAVMLTLEKGEKRGNILYYAGVFVLNGMSGVLSKFYAEAPFEKASAAGYSILTAFCSIAVSGVVLFLFFREKEASAEKGILSGVLCAAGGITNKVANFILVLALAHVDASVQYPMVTGGVMVVSTIICFFGKNKPKKKEILSVIIAFAGLMALFLVR